MELVDRYLNAVKFWLPRAQQDDIITELSEDIRSQIEEKEAELGRKLNEAEVEGILKQLGRPLLMANRYLPQQHLVGPILFPIYQFVLKIVMMCYLVPWVLVWIGLMIFNPAYRAEHSGAALLGTLASFWGSFWLTAFISVGVVTLVFAVLERVQAKTGLVDRWNPHKLPHVRDPNRIPRSSSVLELVGAVVFMTWWLNATWSQTVLEFSGLKITLVPVWRYFWWGFLLVSAVNVAVSGVNLFQPYWTRIRAGMRLAADGAGSVLGCWLLKSAILIQISHPNLSPAKAQEITDAINLWMSRAFPVAAVIGVVIALVDAYRIFRLKAKVLRLTQGVAAVILLTMMAVGASA